MQVSDVPRLKAASNVDIHQFLLLLSQVVPAVYAYENPGKQVVIRAAYPSEFIAMDEGGGTNLSPSFIPTITYDLVRRMPGTLNDAPFQYRKDIKPRYREYHKTGEEGREYVELSGQWFDNLIELACWCKSDMEAFQLCKWLEDHLELFRGYYKEKGVQEMFYYGGGSQALSTTIREAMQRWRNPWKVRGFTYYVRTESLYSVDYREIKRILVSLQIEK